jgi:transcriptional regulator with XRE-family HTH domain
MSEDVRRMVARNVRRLRIAAGLSQAALAERMGADRAYVSGLELGQRNPTILTLWHIAKALDVKLSLFFKEQQLRKGAAHDRTAKP